MSQQLIIFGNASQKIITTIEIKKEDYSVDLLSLLRLNNIPIASSCDGDGVCKKCMINNDVISCQIKLQDFIAKYGDTIHVAYL